MYTTTMNIFVAINQYNKYTMLQQYPMHKQIRLLDSVVPIVSR